MSERIERTRLQRAPFLVLFALAVYAFWRTIEPIWVPVFLGLVIAIAVYPIHEKLLHKLGGKHPGLPAPPPAATVMLVALAPLTFLVFVVGHRVAQLVQGFAGRYPNQ